MVEPEGDIPGIHHFCDGWCERCPYTSRCTLFKQQEEVFADPASQDIRNVSFWRNLHAYMAQAVLILQSAAKMKGLDLDEMMVEAEADTCAEEHPLVRAAGLYARFSQNFFERGELLASPFVEDTSRLEQVSSAVKVLRQYQYFLPARLARTVTAEDTNPQQRYQQNGSIKVALVVMERCLEAWVVLFEAYPERRETMLTCINMLHHLQEETNIAFPDAKHFVRPGFDHFPQADINETL